MDLFEALTVVASRIEKRVSSRRAMRTCGPAGINEDDVDEAIASALREVAAELSGTD